MNHNHRHIEAAYDKIASRYDNDYGGSMARAEDKAIKSLVAPYVTSKTVYDLGCGTGLLLDWLLQPSDYLGIDISQNMLAIAALKNPGKSFRHDNAWAKIHHPANSVVSLFGSPSYSPLGEVVEGVKNHLRGGGGFFLMPYASGRLRATNGKLVDHHADLWKIHKADFWLSMLKLFGAKDIEIRGFNLLRSSKLLRWEAPLAKRFPDRCQYLIITGVM